MRAFEALSPRHRVRFKLAGDGEYNGSVASRSVSTESIATENRVYEGSFNGKPVDMSNDVISITTQKQYGHAAGGFTVVFKPRDVAFFEKVLLPDDMVVIELGRGDSEHLTPVMVGLVVAINISESYDDQGVIQRLIVVRGMDLGKLMLKHDIGWDLALLNIEGGVPDVERLSKGLQFTGSPKELVESVANNLFFTQVPWAKDFISFDRLFTDDDWQVFDYTLQMRSGGVWDTLLAFCNIPWNVLTTETGVDEKLHVVLEKAPFDEETGKLTRYLKDIGEEEVVSTNLTRSDEDRVNWVYLNPRQILGGIDVTDHLSTLMAAKGFIQYDGHSVGVHGFCQREFQTSLFSWLTKPTETDDIPGPAIDKAIERAIALWNRFKENHLYWGGSIEIIGEPGMRAGDGILHRRREYFVESITHNYVWGDSYTTTMSVTRGQLNESVEKGNPKSAWGDYLPADRDGGTLA